MTIFKPKGPHGQSGADVAEPAPPMAEQAPEASVWADLSEKTDSGAFGRAWLTLCCRPFAALQRAALLIGPADVGPFKPIARWTRRPEPGDAALFVAGLDAVLAAALERRQPALEGIGQGAEGSGKVFVGYPLLFAGRLRGVVLAETDALDQASAKRLLRHLQWSSGWIEAFLRRSLEEDTESLVEKATMLVHAVEGVVAERRLADAARLFAGMLEQRFDCDQVVVGRRVRNRTRLIAISQTAVFEARSRHAKLFIAAADEASDQGTALVAPGSPDTPFVTQAQDALRQDSGGAHVLTIPLVADGEAFGAMSLVRARRAFTQGEVDLIDGLGTGVAAVLAEKARTDRPVPLLAFDRATAFAGRLFGPRHLGLKAGALIVVAAALFLSVAKDDYRIHAHAEVQGEVRRSLSAPFDGFIRTARARAGDVVPEGAVLAELQDNDLVLDRLRNLSRKHQYQSELDKALAKGDLAGTNIAQAQVAQADADIELSEQMLARAQLTAPFAAVVVSGDLSQSIGRPVSRGDTLFEIAPLDRYRVTLIVPDSDVRLVSPGMKGEILLSALPEETLAFEIQSVTPVARTLDGVNGFEAIGTLANKDQRIRPGMDGIAKVTVGERSLVWIWTHPLIEWARLKVWGLIP
jgi:hypothetical protein